MSRALDVDWLRLARRAGKGAVLCAVVGVGIALSTTTDETLLALRTFPLAVLPILVLAVCGAWASNGGRIWVLSRALGHRLSYRRALAISMSTEFGLAASPGGVAGPAVRLGLLKQIGIPFSDGTTMLAADMLLDGLFFLLVLPFAIAVVLGDPDWRALLLHLPLPGWRTVLGVMTAVVAALIVLARKGLPLRIRIRIRHALSGVCGSLRRSCAAGKFLFARKRGAILLDFGLACVQWSCRYAVLPLLVLAFSAKRNTLPLVAVQGVLFTLSLVVVVPGGGGSIEMLSLFVLPLFVPKAVVGLVIIAWRFFTYHIYLLVCGTVFYQVLRPTIAAAGPVDSTGFP